MDGPAISVRSLRVERGGREVLHGISLEVARGSVTGLLGPSGSGKSTLIRSLVGVQVVAGGEVEVLGLRAGSAALRPRVAYLTQEPAVYLDLTARENLRFFAQVLDAPGGAVDDALAVVGLQELADRQVRRLSGGQLSRVALATALLGKPELLVLDEPTVGLDPLLRRDLWRTFRRLAAAGATLLVSSHVMDEAAHCDALVLLRDGDVLAAEPPAALLARTGAADLDDAFLALVEAR